VQNTKIKPSAKQRLNLITTQNKTKQLLMIKKKTHLQQPMIQIQNIKPTKHKTLYFRIIKKKFEITKLQIKSQTQNSFVHTRTNFKITYLVYLMMIKM
jgi:hypothetical protein